MATSLATALYYKGADVCLVSTRGYENLPKEIHLIKVNSSLEMYENLKKSLPSIKENYSKKPYLFMVAAVSDYLPLISQNGKLKKEKIGTLWNLELEQNIDILKSLPKDEIYSIGFKAEMNEITALNSATKMLENKNLDGVCLNILNENNNFGSDTNEIELILKNSSFKFKGSKLNISLEIIEKLEKEFSSNE